MSELVRTNVLNTPIGGMATVVDPMFPAKTIPGSPSTPSKLLKEAKRVIEDVTADSPDDPEIDPEYEDQPDATS